MATKKAAPVKVPAKKVQEKEIALVDMTPEELQKKAKELAWQLKLTKLEIGAGKVKNVRSVFTARDQLARVLTVLNSKKVR